jgi:hypothetical protein
VEMTLRAEGGSRIFVQNAIARRVQIQGTNTNSPFVGSGGNVVLSCCSQSSSTGSWSNNAGGAMLLACNTLSASKTALRGSGWCLVQHFVQGTLSVSGDGTSYGLHLSGGRFVVGINNDFNHPGEATQSTWRLGTDLRLVGGAMEVENGAGGTSRWLNAAVVVCMGSQLIVDGLNSYCWGASAVYGYWLTAYANATVFVGNLATGSFAALFTVPATVGWNLANINFAYSDQPMVVENDNCRVIGGYELANNASQTDGGFYLTGQSANAGPTAFPALDKAGMYEVSGYVATTTADAAAVGTPVLNVVFTDDSGVARTLAIATSTALTTLGGSGGFAVIESKAASAISWSTTGVVSAGLARFSVRMRIRKVCFGA